jgi:hypothetical protein
MPESREPSNRTYEGERYALPQETLAKDAVFLPSVHAARLIWKIPNFQSFRHRQHAQLNTLLPTASKPEQWLHCKGNITLLLTNDFYRGLTWAPTHCSCVETFNPARTPASHLRHAIDKVVLQIPHIIHRLAHVDLTSEDTLVAIVDIRSRLVGLLMDMVGAGDVDRSCRGGYRGGGFGDEFVHFLVESFASMLVT